MVIAVCPLSQSCRPASRLTRAHTHSTHSLRPAPRLTTDTLWPPRPRCVAWKMARTQTRSARKKEGAPPQSLRALVGQLAASLLRRPAGDRSDPPFPTTHPHAHTSSGCPHTHALNDPKISLPLSTEIDRHQGQAPHRGQPGPRHGRGRLCGLPPVHLPGRAG